MAAASALRGMAAVFALATLQPGLVEGLSAQPPFWPRFAGKRAVQLLDGRWEFGLHVNTPVDAMARDFDTRSPALTPNVTEVPSVVDLSLPGYVADRGVAMYRTRFYQEGRARLQFMGCAFYCRVFVDGVEVGDHLAGGYVPFTLDVAAQESGAEVQERELFVLADYRFNRTTAPLYVGGDYFKHGGLMRSVILHDLPEEKDEVWVWRAYVQPLVSDPTKVNITLVLTDSNFAGELDVWMSFDGEEPPTMQTLKASGGTASLVGVPVPNPRMWSFEDPQLHTVTVTLSGATIIERFGLRAWGTDPATSRITLNGRIVRLAGWNHHTLWPDTGGSPTDEQLDEDIQLMKQTYTNFVRGAHYPQDQRWLDRLDEAGMAMWEETMGPDVKVPQFTDWDVFMKYQLQQVNEMIDASMNHASIMAWGWFNEGQSDKVDSCPAYAACAKVAADRDPTRFRTWASNRELRDVCFEHATLLAVNAYPCWYGHYRDFAEPQRHWSNISASLHQRNPGKPFVISEVGAGGIFIWNNNETDVEWSLKYQNEVLEHNLDVILKDDYISGVTIWHLFDFKAGDAFQKQCGSCQYVPGAYPPTCGYYNMTRCKAARPGGTNHKGVVDFWRRKKPSFDIVAKKFHDAKLAANDHLEQMVI